MIQRQTACAILEEFYGKYEDLEKRDTFIQEARKRLIELCGGDRTDYYGEVENTLLDLVTACGTVGYCIGVEDGAKLLSALTSGGIAERFLTSLGEIT